MTCLGVKVLWVMAFGLRAMCPQVEDGNKEHRVTAIFDCSDGLHPFYGTGPIPYPCKAGDRMWWLDQGGNQAPIEGRLLPNGNWTVQ